MQDNKSLHHPHNNLFEKAFSNPQVTWDFLKGRLNPSILKQLDSKSLKLESNSFVDAKLKKSYSDLVMSVELANKKSYIYFLIEHQTQNEKHMMFRLLKYNINLMERHIEQGGKKLPTIINFVLYAGKHPYTGAKNILEAFEHPTAFVHLLKKNTIIELMRDDDDVIIKDDKAALVELVLKYRSIVDAVNAMQKLGLNVALIIKKIHYWQSALYYAMEVGDDTPEDILKKSNILDPNTQHKTMTTLQILRNEGIKIGQKEGIKLGQKEGIKLGKKEGIKLGQKEGVSNTKLKIAKGMLEKGMDAKFIQELTGLSSKEFDKLKTKYNKSR